MKRLQTSPIGLLPKRPKLAYCLSVDGSRLKAGMTVVKACEPFGEK